MRLAGRERDAVAFLAHRVHRRQREQVWRRGTTVGIGVEVQVDDVLAADAGDQFGGVPSAITFPWSITATRSQSRSASSM